MLHKFKDKYKFDKMGNVYSRYSSGRVPKLLDTPKLMKSQIDKDGYIRYTLRDNNKKQHTVFQHKIVLIMNNVQRGTNQDQVNHKDGDRLNNKVENLEWCTSQENNQHKVSNLQYRNLEARKFSSSDVQTIRKEYVPFKRGSGIEFLAKKYKCSYTTMRDIVQHKTYNSDTDYAE